MVPASIEVGPLWEILFRGSLVVFSGWFDVIKLFSA